MTAVVGILNKTTVALAADSAATITGPFGDKVYNHAHKLFNLSAKAPVGLMIYNSSELVGLPWETLIKMCRQELGGQTFSTLPEYATFFLDFVRQYACQTHSTSRLLAVQEQAWHLWVQVWRNFETYLARKQETEAFNRSDESERNDTANTNLTVVVLPEVQQIIINSPLIDDLSGYDFAAFLTEFGQEVRQQLQQRIAAQQELALSEANLDTLLELVHLELTHTATLNPWTGVVVSGFGESELFPSLVSYRVGPVLGGTLRVVKQDEESISSHGVTASVKPYAQTNDIMAFITGIDPALQAVIDSSADTAFDQFIATVAEQLAEGEQAEFRNYLAEHKGPVLQGLRQSLEQVSQERNVQPIMGAVALASKEELAEMAESLISLTSLKRKFSFAAESVGGPVDVAVITKGEGFIWLKRKQYFKPELNLNYISSVLNRLPTHSHLNSFTNEPDSIQP